MLLEQLQDFQDILASVLVLQDISFASSKDKGKLAFAQYISKLSLYYLKKYFLIVFSVLFILCNP